ncbi:MAG: MBL fold metallo-hydrolase, partial [Defluviicoccus sp.]|nr:MBL fold metallo-hydrolase [Defluviicoccus sp.]
MAEDGIPFRKRMAFSYGRAEAVAAGVRRIVCNNPSPFTFHGTNSYVVGEGEVAVIDPGPDDSDHVEALKREVAGETVTHVIVTHTHIDHSPASRAFARAVGAPVVGALPAPPADG